MPELEFQLLFLNLNINCVVCDLEDEALIKEIQETDVIFDLAAPQVEI